MRISSPAFAHNDAIPRQYTCEGGDINPPLRISDVPEDTKSLALICDDPDAATDPNGPGHTFDHWVLWNIPPALQEISENHTPQTAVTGLNSVDKHAYMGPCPPTGMHRYFFRLYALDSELELPEDSDVEALEDAVAGHVLARAELIGTYQKSQ